MSMVERFIERELENELKRLVSLYKVLTVLGPRQAGKSTITKSIFMVLGYEYLNLEDSSVLNQAVEDPKGFLINHPSPLIIDEIQVFPELVSQIQANVDENPEKGQYILTGSYQVKLRDTIAQSLAGRTAIVHMLPLSFSELETSGVSMDRNSQMITGFMPYIYSVKNIPPGEYYSYYKINYLEKDIRKNAYFKDIREFHIFMDVLAGRAGQLLNYSAISNDVGVSSTTVKSWISLLESTYIVYILPPWSKNLTSRAVKAPKLYFTETGLLASYMRISTPKELGVNPLTGALFENMVVIEALKARYNSCEDPDLYFYRDSNGVEVDIVFERTSQEVDLFEIKASYSVSRDFSKGMDRFASLHPELKVTKHVIYSGNTLQEPVNEVFYINYKDTGKYLRKESKFIPPIW